MQSTVCMYVCMNVGFCMQYTVCTYGSWDYVYIHEKCMYAIYVNGSCCDKSCMQYICIFAACIKVCTCALRSAYLNMFVCKRVYMYLCVFKKYMRACITNVFDVHVC